MSALPDSPALLKGEPYCPNLPVGDYTIMEHNNKANITPSLPEYRFPDLANPLASISPPDSPSDSPSTSTSALPSASSSGLSLHPTTRIVYPPQPLDTLDTICIRDLCLPTLTPQEILGTLDHLATLAPKKKSHARKQPAGHIPRPRNAFILFRCLFVSQQAVPASVEKDHRNISRIAGKVWKSMSPEERDPWQKASELEKSRHEARWPGYRYNPIQGQAFPRRFPLKAPPGARTTPKRDEDDDYVERPRPAAKPAAAAASVARVDASPPATRAEQFERDSKCDHVASLVREGKKGVELEAAIRGPAAAALSDFLASHARPHPFGGDATTPSGFHQSSIPPDSRPPTPTHFRLANRRSSSCPPLPPVAFTFQDPWATTAAAAAPSSSSDSPSPFAFAFSPGDAHQQPESPFALPPPAAALGHHEMQFDDEHRPLTAPEHHELLPRLNLDVSSRLMHRRGSSLDRAIASSSIAGAFGESLPRASLFNIHQWTHHSHVQQQPDIISGHATPTPTEFSSSSGAATPALSPQASFTSTSSSEESLRGRSYTPRALTASSTTHSAAAAAAQRSRSRTALAVAVAAPEFRVPFHPSAAGTLHLSPPTPPYPKISARLFGSQGTRLGLDLDLDIPLALDVSLASPSPSDTTTATYERTTPESSGSSAASSLFSPYTPPAGPEHAPYSFPYTQALMDADLAV